MASASRRPCIVRPVHRALALAALLLSLRALGDGAYLALRLDRAAAGHEVWRLVTAHFVHLGWAHALLNACGAMACLLLAPAVFDRRFWPRLLGLAVGVGLCLAWLSPSVADYAGLSGVLYGLFAWGLLDRGLRGERMAWPALALVCAWALWQWLRGPVPAEEDLIGGSIVTAAHLYGLALGAISALASRRNRLAGD